MSHDKAIKSGKEHRKPFTKGKAVDITCRNHGGCDWCEGNRKHANKKNLQRALTLIFSVVGSSYQQH